MCTLNSKMQHILTFLSLLSTTLLDELSELRIRLLCRRSRFVLGWLSTPSSCDPRLGAEGRLTAICSMCCSMVKLSCCLERSGRFSGIGGMDEDDAVDRLLSWRLKLHRSVQLKTLINWPLATLWPTRIFSQKIPATPPPPQKTTTT